MNGKKQGRSWEKLVGYTIEDLIKHLENQFTGDMSWENYGKWELDHIKPKSLFKYETAEDAEFKKCWALENLQPLSKIENRKKRNKYIN
jgi:5-methylcytosine-specific restriction endonuclease McrA